MFEFIEVLIVIGFVVGAWFVGVCCVFCVAMSEVEKHGVWIFGRDKYKVVRNDAEDEDEVICGKFGV